MIITTPNKFVAEVHDRMPVLLKPEQFEHWLSGDMGVKELKPIDNGYASRTRGDEPAIHSAGAFSWMRPRRRGDEPIASTRSEVPPVASPARAGEMRVFTALSGIQNGEMSERTDWQPSATLC
jgi:SOS response associated peptidase (SRAP)